MKEIKLIEKRIGKVKAKLMAMGDMHPGSLTKQFNICGNPNCKCKDKKNPKKHGPYYQLSYVINKKSSSRFIQNEFVKEVKKQIENYKKFKQLIEEWKNLAAEAAKLKTKQSKQKKHKN